MTFHYMGPTDALLLNSAVCMRLMAQLQHGDCGCYKTQVRKEKRSAVR